MKLREFTDAGIEAFKAYLAECRLQPTTPPPIAILEDDTLSRIVAGNIEVEPKTFTVRREASEYLSERLESLNTDDVARNSGLWTWLTLYYFDQVCPPTAGKRSIKNDYHYVFEPDNSRHYYRHLLHIGWRVCQLAGDYNRLYLNTPLASLDKVTTEVMKRLFITRIPCIFEVLDRLYWDDSRGKPRRGIVGSHKLKPGDLGNRLPVRIRQLERTYDLHSLSADQMIDLLGEEFTGGRPNQKTIPGT